MRAGMAVASLLIVGVVGCAATVEPPARSAPGYGLQTYEWTHESGPVRMIRKDEGFCFLSKVNGQVAGGAECLRVFVGDDGFWYLDGSTQAGWLKGEAIAVRFTDGR